jgi:hypothetical protein
MCGLHVPQDVVALSTGDVVPIRFRVQCDELAETFLELRDEWTLRRCPRARARPGMRRRGQAMFRRSTAEFVTDRGPRTQAHGGSVAMNLSTRRP